MNVIQTHEMIVSDYASYIQNFITIADQEMRWVLSLELCRKKVRPEPPEERRNVDCH